MKDLPLKQKLLWGLIIILTLVSAGQTIFRLAEIYPKKKPHAFAFTGKKFSGLEKLLKNEKYAGYYTDMPDGKDRTTMELLQAQHEVVPLILDPDSIEHRYIIVNCINIPQAIEKFKALGAIPLTRNNMGIFVVERPEFRP